MAEEFGSLLDPQGNKWHMSRRRGHKGSFEVKFVQVFPERTIELASDPEFTGASLRVYIWTLEGLSHREWRFIDQQSVADQLHISRPSVSIAMGHLERKGFLEKKGSRLRTYWRVTPKGSWMGTAGAYQAEKRRRAKPDLELFEGGKNDNHDQTEFNPEGPTPKIR